MYFITDLTDDEDWGESQEDGIDKEDVEKEKTERVV